MFAKSLRQEIISSIDLTAGKNFNFNDVKQDIDSRVKAVILTLSPMYINKLKQEIFSIAHVTAGDDVLDNTIKQIVQADVKAEIGADITKVLRQSILQNLQMDLGSRMNSNEFIQDTKAKIKAELGTVGTSQAKKITQDLLQSSIIDMGDIADFNSIKQIQKADIKLDFGDHFDVDRIKQEILSAASVKMGQNSAKYVPTAPTPCQ